MESAIVSKHTKVSDKEPPKAPNPNLFFLLLIGIGLILVVSQFKGRDFIVQDEDGKLHLSEEREQKLQKKLEELDEAEQYALLALIPAYYDCYHCIGSLKIFLNTGEVWKYGVTRKGQQGRYTDAYLDENNLFYVPQYVGTLQDCMKEEQRKIFYYALLPENTKRDVPLIRPPGNKIDQ